MRLRINLCQLALLAYLFQHPLTQASAAETMVKTHPVKETSSVWWTEKQVNGHPWIKVKVLIGAPASAVWQAMHKNCEHDPDVVQRKVISKSGNEETLEEKLGWLPLVGTATCTLHSTEIPLERMDYSMVSSDRFKALEGSWVLTPGPGTDSTYLELSSYCDIGIPVPRFLREGITVKKLQTRLLIVKKVAESTSKEKRIAETDMSSRR